MPLGPLGWAIWLIGAGSAVICAAVIVAVFIEAFTAKAEARRVDREFCERAKVRM